MAKQRRSGQSATDLLALILGAACLLGAAAAQGGRVSPALDTLTNFAPAWLIGSGLTAGYGAAFATRRTRATILGLGVLGILAAALLILPEITRPIEPAAPAGAGRTIKLIQFNTWDRNGDITGTANWIAAQSPDLVLVEEAGAPLRRALIARGYHCTTGNGHVAILSRMIPDREPVRVLMSEWPRLPPFARARFGQGAQGFSVFAVHLTRTREKNSARDALAGLLDRYDRDRLIVAGDFNLTPWSFALRGLDRELGLERRDRALFSWPAKLILQGRTVPAIPVLPLDHVYAGAAWRTVSIARGPAMGSDHFPVVAILALGDSPAP